MSQGPTIYDNKFIANYETMNKQIKTNRNEVSPNLEIVMSQNRIIRPMTGKHRKDNNSIQLIQDESSANNYYFNNNDSR